MNTARSNSSRHSHVFSKCYTMHHREISYNWLIILIWTSLTRLDGAFVDNSNEPVMPVDMTTLHLYYVFRRRCNYRLWSRCQYLFVANVRRHANRRHCHGSRWRWLSSMPLGDETSAYRIPTKTGEKQIYWFFYTSKKIHISIYTYFPSLHI